MKKKSNKGKFILVIDGTGITLDSSKTSIEFIRNFLPNEKKEELHEISYTTLI